MSGNYIILTSVIVYMVLMIIIGIWALRKTKTSNDFFMAGRNLGVMVTAFAIFSSTLSGFGFVGGPGLVYQMGMSSVWMVASAGMGFTLSGYLLSKRLRLFSERSNSISLPDVVFFRYKNNNTRLLVSIAIVLGVFGYMATQILAMSIVLQDILSKTEAMADVSLITCMIISCSILVFYSVTGGIIASVYTDLVQGAIMICAAVFIFATVVSTYDGGLVGMSTTIAADNPAAIGPWGTLGMVGCLSWFFLFTLGSTGQPHVITKTMMNKKISDARSIMPISAGGYLASALLWVGIGLVMRAMVLDGSHPELTSPDQAAAQFLQNYTSPILAGIVFSGLFAAIMSTADAFLNIGTAAIVNDIPKAIGKNPRGTLGSARIATVLITLVAAVFALYSGDLVAIMGAFGWGTFAAAIVPTVALGFNWKRATPLAANVAIVAGLLINFTVKIFGIRLPYGFDVGALALLTSLILFMGISFASKPPRLSKDVEEIMDY